eukprot:scaffold670123_cov76-Prasinocladus_malaysianus.AAC.1
MQLNTCELPNLHLASLLTTYLARDTTIHDFVGHSWCCQHGAPLLHDVSFVAALLAADSDIYDTARLHGC